MAGKLVSTFIAHGKPKGPVDGTILRGSILITYEPPVMAAGTTVADLGTFMRDWPSLLPSIRFKVYAATTRDAAGTQIGEFRPPTLASTASAEWARVIPANTLLPAAPHDVFGSGAKLRSYGPQALLQGISQVRKKAIAESRTSWPTFTQVDFADVMKLTPANKLSIGEPFEARLASSLGVVPVVDRGWLPNQTDEQNDASTLLKLPQNLVEVDKFLDRPPNPNVDAPVTPPKLDLAVRLGALRQHPALMRRLGLVLDVSATVTAPLSGDYVKFRVQPVVQLTETSPVPWNEQPELLSPWIDVDPDTWLTMGSNSHNDPVLHYPSTYRVHNTSPVEDAVGMIRYYDALANLELAPVGEAASTSERLEPQPPPRRTRGLSVSSEILTEQFRTRFLGPGGKALRALALSSDPAVAKANRLRSEALHKGWRVDVKGMNSPWFSLMQRRVRYEFEDGTSFEVDEEGFVAPSLSGSANPNDPYYYLDPLVATWSGWSLAAPRPGSAIDPNDLVTRHDPAPLKGLGYRRIILGPIPGSLPMLRFGRHYTMRLRSVDLTGWSFDHDDATLASDWDSVLTETVGQRFRRAEPVLPPHVVMPRPFLPAEQLDQVVVRSHWWDSPTSSFERARWLVPPRTSQQLAEWHGCFDSGTGRVDPGAYDVAASRESQQYESGSNAVPDPGRPGSTYRSENTLPVLYLPDPMASAMVVMADTSASPSLVSEPINFTAGAHQVSTFQDLKRSWPAWRTVNLRARALEQGAKTLTLDPGPDAGPLVDGPPAPLSLDVSIPKGTVTTVRIASQIRKDDLALFDLPELPDVDGQESWESLFRRGAQWALTPPRKLTLVHAVKQPVLAPRLSDVVVFQTAASGHRRFAGTVDWHKVSTQEVTLGATWTEFIDDVTEDAPREVEMAATLGSTRLTKVIDPGTDAEGRATAAFDTPYDFPDAKHRRVTITPTAATSFLEHFRETKVLDLTDGAIVTLAAPGTDEANGRAIGGFVEGTVRVVDPDGKRTYRAQAGIKDLFAHYRVDHEAGQIVWLTTAATVSVSWIANPVVRVGAPVVVSTKASKRPDPPVVVDVLPTFKRIEPAGAGFPRAYQRIGRGLRIYLARPWFSSGEGERLGVVLRAGTGDIPTIASRWGRDPVHGGKAPGDTTYVSGVFPKAISTPTVPLPEVPGLALKAAVHNVAFDPERKLWYADIELPANSAYWPFVQLRLVRYQAQAMDFVEDGEQLNMRVSPVVTVDWAQPAPNRTLIVDKVLGGGRKVTLIGQGFRPSGATEQLVAKVTFEKRADNRDGDFGWKKVGQTATLTTEVNSSTFLTTHKGTLSIPDGATRMVVEEFEQISSQPPDGPPSTSLRLVYLEVVSALNTSI